MPQPIPFGAFELLEPIGKGGMAVVWKGRHRAQGIPVAVKVMTGGQAVQPQFRAAFRNELRALAGLEHPGVVLLWDYGEVEPMAEHLSDGRLITGNPFLVMELASRGTLNQLMQPLAWTDLKRIMLSILDALAYAHSRGIIHLDLKPANVLLSGEGDARTGLKLTDFGLAYMAGHATRSQAQAGKQGVTAQDLSAWMGRIPGTPLYMAPEQFEGAFRDYGPWTDLYAVGCIAWKLCSGLPPFAHENFMQLMFAHLQKAPPPLRPRRPVPQGFEDWLLTLLQKKPGARFQRAADAAWALLALSDEETTHHQPLEPSVLAESVDLMLDPANEEPLTEVNTVSQWFSNTLTSLAPLPRGERLVLEMPTAMAMEHPPLPASWERRETPALWKRLLGAGLGLYGLRSIPFVGRERERNLIWDALRRVHETGRAHALILQGPSGTGKSRLAEWMAERAHEVGSATILKAPHSHSDGPTDGLTRMVTRQLQCSSLPRTEVLERVIRLLQDQKVSDEYEWYALTEIMQPEESDPEFIRTAGPRSTPRIRFNKPTERYEVILRLLQRLAQERPLILWLEDVQWGSDTLSFVDYLLSTQVLTKLPLLLLLTVQDEALQERPQESGQLEALLRYTEVSKIPLPLLARDDHLGLVQQLLHMEPALAAEVAERTRGNPLFAVQLVGDWVQRGLLERGEQGYMLKSRTEAILPDSLHEVWMARLNRLLSAQPRDAVVSLELAAVLGREVSSVEWRAACRVRGVTPPPELLELLSSSRLVEVNDWEISEEGLLPSSWEFVHGMLSESLSRLALEAGRRADHHRACVIMLQQLNPQPSPGVLGRMGRHYSAAGDYEAALTPLFEAATSYYHSSEIRLAHAVLDDIDRALRAKSLPVSDRRWGRGWILRGQVHLLQGNLQEAMQVAGEAEASAENHGREDVRAYAVELAARILELRGEHGLAIRRFQEALTLFRQQGMMRGVADSLKGLASCARETGDLHRMEEWLRQAFGIYRQLDEREGMADTIHLLGKHALLASDPQRALQLFQQANRDFERLGNQPGRADTLRSMGAAMMRIGNLQKGIEHMQHAKALYHRAGAQLNVATCLNNLAELERLAGRYENAVAGYQQAIAIQLAMHSPGGAVLPRFNLALLYLHTRQFAEALPVLIECRNDLELSGRLVFYGAVQVALLPCYASARDWTAWTACLREAREFGERKVIEPDDAWPVQLAGDLALEAGETARAREAYALALTLWQVVKEESKVAELEAILEKLESAPAGSAPAPAS